VSEAVAPSRRTRDVDLIVLDGPAASQSETPASVDDDPIVFRNLPFVVVRHAERWEHGASAVRRIELYPPSRLLWLLGLDWLISRQVDVINLSVGFLGEFDPSEPVHVATRTAVERHIVVVVAAGNEGPMQGTLQEVAQAERMGGCGRSDGFRRRTPRVLQSRMARRAMARGGGRRH
jgi:hypothetical protein